MRSRAVVVAALAVAFGLSACGKYGPPVRSVQGDPSASAEATGTRPERPDLDETTTQPSDFEF